MPRSRSRSRSYSPRARPTGGMRRERDLRTSLLFRNLSKTTTADDLRHTTERFGPIRDIYLPKDFYTGDPRGLGFVEFSDPKDAEEARHSLDGSTLAGRVISVQFAQHGRKRPEDYRNGGSGGYHSGSGGGYGSSRGGGYDRDHRDRGYRDYDYGRDRDYRDRDRDYRDRDRDYRDRDRDRDYRGKERDRDRDSRRHSRSPRRGRSRSPRRSPRRDRSVSRSRSPPPNVNNDTRDREIRDDRGRDRERSPDQGRRDSGRELARSPDARSPTPNRSNVLSQEMVLARHDALMNMGP
ncbi:hypothetical protein VOLCADRAFT_121229 [Volvox carteri f. nagariensis]|uniref:RRM domain-containing protein n=1 Tax=Volvox carteri f. nagariensis TaxID=3068 RepID=D8U5J6_VOLCA|nr:uncharacterized protein VOLCADRAFT_121229 [Volvox carteri f. nagariensis]EFJ44931.1 hypothetical protein VOLCADRAFT_121229 [Volvox carteri f. nagariensis]|eukprot:XP_002953902.1 hypothetical protein VOLCADRAFT_121229 [Volvox carteri f. nagariensis]